MGTLTVTFTGICAFIPRDALVALDPTIPPDLHYRVVVPNAVNGSAYMHDEFGFQPIPPHISALVLNGPIARTVGAVDGLMQYEPRKWLLRGVHLAIDNIVGSFEPPIDFNLVPSLHEHAPNTQLALSPNMVLLDQSAGFFDITAGQMTSSYFQNEPTSSVITQLVAQTDGLPRLRVRTFYNNAIGTIELADENAAVSVSNIGVGGVDTIYDWVLHYRVCTDTPGTIIPPGKVTARLDGLNSGCSNSQWP